MASGLVKMPVHAPQFSAEGFRVPSSNYCSQSLPASDLMPSVHTSASTTLSSAAVHRGHGARQAPHSSTSSRAFYNSYYPPPPQHKPLNAPNDGFRQIVLPPSPPVFARPASGSLQTSEEFSPSSVPADGFSGFSEMSRSLTDFGANPLHASSGQSISSRSNHNDSFENGDDRLCSQIDGLDISATSSSPTVLSIMTEYSLKQRQSQSRGTRSLFSALSSSNSSRQTSPNATQRLSSIATSSDASSSIFSRHNNARAAACVPQAVQEEVFEFEMEETDDMRPASSSNSSSSSSSTHHEAASSLAATLNNPWQGGAM